MFSCQRLERVVHAQEDGGTRAVLDSIVAGPFCGALLAGFGAEGMKTEMPGRGDDVRRMGPQEEGVVLVNFRSGRVPGDKGQRNGVYMASLGCLKSTRTTLVWHENGHGYRTRGDLKCRSCAFRVIFYRQGGLFPGPYEQLVHGFLLDISGKKVVLK
jgi:CoA-transferase family III